MSETSQVTALLRAHRQGDTSAFERLVPLLYDELRGVAQRQLAWRRQGKTLLTTALVHEAYLRLVDDREVDYQDRQHFLAIAALTMRRVLVDHAREKGAQKRGGDRHRVTLTGLDVAVEHDAVTILAIDRALEALSTFSEQLTRVVECRFFAGFTEEETAEALGTSTRTVQREWRRARAWLRRQLELDGGLEPAPG